MRFSWFSILLLSVRFCSAHRLVHSHLKSGLCSQQNTQTYNLNCKHKHTEMPNYLAQRKIKLAARSCTSTQEFQAQKSLFLNPEHMGSCTRDTGPLADAKYLQRIYINPPWFLCMYPWLWLSPSSPIFASTRVSTPSSTLRTVLFLLVVCNNGSHNSLTPAIKQLGLWPSLCIHNSKICSWVRA
jgi:hypothetical protein